MAQILVESEALDSLKRMVEELEKDSAGLRGDIYHIHALYLLGDYKKIEGVVSSRIAAMSKE